MVGKRLLTASIALGATLLCATVCAQSTVAQSSSLLEQPVSQQLLERLRDVSEKGLNRMPPFQGAPLTAIDDEQPPPAAPLVLYIGADFCPFCAVLRWPLALALMRFGDLSGLLYTRSSSTDVYPNTATFSFRSARLDSDYLRLEAVELQDREGQRLQKPDAMQREKFLRFDGNGSIPFLYLGGRYVQVGAPFSPAPIQNLDWPQIVQRLEEGDNAAWQTITGEADVLTAALCVVTNQQPATVCAAPAIKAAAQRLPQ